MDTSNNRSVTRLTCKASPCRVVSQGEEGVVCGQASNVSLELAGREESIEDIDIQDCNAYGVQEFVRPPTHLYANILLDDHVVWRPSRGAQ